MKGSRLRNHSPAFKAKIALQAICGDKTLTELASHLHVYPTRSPPGSSSCSSTPPSCLATVIATPRTPNSACASCMPRSGSSPSPWPMGRTPTWYGVG